MTFILNNKKLVIIILLSTAIGFWQVKNQARKAREKRTGSVTAPEGSFYWTCPMHPHIHSDHPGECPICHMKLVKVKSDPAAESDDSESEKRSNVQTTKKQLNLIGIQKHEVEKMTLRISIPVSGRFISSGSVAFQIYESDLRYIKPGLFFEGESSFYPEERVTGTVSSVDSIVDPTSRTVRVVGLVSKGGHGNAPETGFRGNVLFKLDNRTAVPESAVVRTGGSDLVYIFKDSQTLAAQSVKLGLKSEGFYDVLDGIKPGDIISSGPNFLIDSEAKIRGVGAQHDQSNH